MKKCNKCKKYKNIFDFYKNKSNKNGLSGQCKDCNLIRNKEYRKNNKKKIKETNIRYYIANKKARLAYNKKWKLKNRYNTTIEKKNYLFKKQKKKCGICDNIFPKEKLQIDHDHKTGIIRGLLCYKCNSAIGFLKEDINILHRAISYLIINESR